MHISSREHHAPPSYTSLEYAPELIAYTPYITRKHQLESPASLLIFFLFAYYFYIALCAFLSHFPCFLLRFIVHGLKVQRTSDSWILEKRTTAWFEYFFFVSLGLIKANSFFFEKLSSQLLPQSANDSFTFPNSSFQNCPQNNHIIFP